jgi:hypothetical protein
MSSTIGARLRAAWQSLINRPSHVEISYCHIFPRPNDTLIEQMGPHQVRVRIRRYVIIPTEVFVGMQSRMTLAGLDPGPAVNPDHGESVEYEIPTVSEQQR